MRSRPCSPASPSQVTASRTISLSAATPFPREAPPYPYPESMAYPTKTGTKDSSSWDERMK
eukprot:3669153-Heterocapsa_arctica.AAC.1